MGTCLWLWSQLTFFPFHSNCKFFHAHFSNVLQNTGRLFYFNLYTSLILITVSQAETTTHRIPAKIFKPYPAINKPTFHHHHKKHPEGITIIQAAKVVEITTEKPKPKSIKFTYELLDRYYKDGWKEKDVKNSRNIPVPDFLKFAVPMEKSQRRMDVKYVYLDE